MKSFLLLLLLLVSTLLFAFSNAFCGDSICNPPEGETQVSCTLDCFCGDGICDFAESYIICPDCRKACGNLVCDSTESPTTCPIDCAEDFASCGNEICDIGETNINCFSDCPVEVTSQSVLYVLYIYNAQTNYPHTCNVSVWDLQERLIDAYQMAVVASGKTVPNSGTYYIEALCDNSGSASQWIYLDSGTSGMVLSLPIQQCGDGECTDSESSFTCPEDCDSEDCQPSCAGRICGDNGCGGSCGTCSTGQNCLGGACVSSCTPSCSGRVCGDNGCGGSCGTCSFGFNCVNGLCVTSCTPNCNGRNCGDNGCGGSCGACSVGQSCVNGVCSTVCTPNCSGRNCGDNGCGGSCGTCSTGQSCNNGLCSAAPCTPNCSGRNCGDNGCGGSCGTCSTGQICSNGLCSSSCTPNCSGRNCGDNGCGGSCGTCAFGQSCLNGLCSSTCTPNCTGRVCGDNGCGGSCGACPSGLSCLNGACSNISCYCDERDCGYPNPGCEQLCGLCDYDQFCTSQGFCSSNWTVSYYVTAEESGCPDDVDNCIVGSSSLLELVNELETGDSVVVAPGTYCGGFTISTEGVRLTGQPGAVIVPCSSQWWDPAPPNCQAFDGAPGTPCSLANSLITITASSVSISGFEFNGMVPNALFEGAPGIQVYNDDGTAIGAGRAIANWVASSSRTHVDYPVVTINIANNTFSYFEESAIRIKRSTVTIEFNSFSNIGSIGAIVDRRQSKTEKLRGSRKAKPGAPIVLDESAGSVSGNEAVDCDYGGLSGGDYPPSSFPFKKRSVASRNVGSQYDYQLVQWARNNFRNLTFGGIIVESMRFGRQRIFGNIVSGEGGRGLIIEDNSESSIEVKENSIQGVEMAAWVWKTEASFINENYQFLQTGIHLVSCNRFEETQPLASSSIEANETEIDSTNVAFWVQDEPASNPLCSSSSSIFLRLTVEGGLISNSEVGLQTAGQRLDASSVSIFTDSVETKTVVKSNSFGQTASAQQVPPSCPPTCSGHGQCGGINICSCQNGYYEDDCSVEICGDHYCTASETAEICPDDCLFRIRRSTITLQFGGIFPTPSCCSVPAEL